MPAVAEDKNAAPRDIVPGFAEMVRKRREQLGWSPYTLAEKAEVGVTTVYDIEAERRSPSLRVAMQLVRALQIDTTLAEPDLWLRKRPWLGAAATGA